MVNAYAKDLLINTKKYVDELETSSVNMWRSFKEILRYIMAGRIGLTIFIIIWTVVISILIVRNNTDKTDESDNPSNPSNPNVNYIRYFNLHKVLFGDESVLLILFKLWYYVLFLWVAGPIFKEFIIFMKMRMIL